MVTGMTGKPQRDHWWKNCSTKQAAPVAGAAEDGRLNFGPMRDNFCSGMSGSLFVKVCWVCYGSKTVQLFFLVWWLSASFLYPLQKFSAAQHLSVAPQGPFTGKDIAMKGGKSFSFIVHFCIYFHFRADTNLYAIQLICIILTVKIIS